MRVLVRVIKAADSLRAYTPTTRAATDRAFATSLVPYTMSRPSGNTLRLIPPSSRSLHFTMYSDRSTSPTIASRRDISTRSTLPFRAGRICIASRPQRLTVPVEGRSRNSNLRLPQHTQSPLRASDTDTTRDRPDHTSTVTISGTARSPKMIFIPATT